MPIFRAVVTIDSPFITGVGTNTWHARSGETGDAANPDMEDCGQALEDYYTALKPIFPTGTVHRFDGVWTRVDGSSGDLASSTGWQVLNTNSTASLPPANCIVSGWRTPSGGRKGRGRTFHSPINVEMAGGNGHVTTAAVATVDGADQGIVSFNGNADGTALVIWSTVDQTGRDITQSKVRDVFGVLRSRRD